MGNVVLPILMLVLLWVLMIRPQQRRLRAHQLLVASLRVGDEVLAAGGIHGRIVALDDATVELEIADGVVVRVIRSAVNARLGDEAPVDVGGTEIEDEVIGELAGDVPADDRPSRRSDERAAAPDDERS